MALYNKVDFNFENFVYFVQSDKSFQESLLKNLKPLKMNSNSFIIFDSRILHGTFYNISKHTRVSIDVRIILKDDFNKMKKIYKGTGRLKLPFDLDKYYFNKSILDIDLIN